MAEPASGLADRRVVALLVLAGISLAALPFVPSIPQDPRYHSFADSRTLLGIPNFHDVISNLPFVLIGLWGLWRLIRPSAVSPGGPLADRRERPGALVLVSGVLLTGLGSGWYHLHPANEPLVWDRLPMTLGFMALLSLIVQERIDLVWGRRLLWPLVFLGGCSVLWWIVTEWAARGDLRLYGWVQFFPTLAVPLMLWWFPPHYSGTRGLVWAFLFYAGAKLTEALDHDIYDLPLILSGHSWKHYLAAASAFCLVRWITGRRALPGAAPWPPPRPASPAMRTIGWLMLGLAVYGVASVGAATLLVTPIRKHANCPPDLRDRLVNATLQTDDGLTIAAWVGSPPHARATVVLAHGLGNARRPERVRFLLQAGYRVVAIDLRAHGDSDGDVTTFGLYEGRDLDAAIGYVERRWPTAPIVGWGTSLGAAAIVCASQRDRLAAIVLESPYESLREAYENRLRMRLPSWLVWAGFGPRIAAQRIIGVDSDELDLTRRVRGLDGDRVLLVTGADDRRAPPAGLHQLAAAIGDAATVVVLPGAGHVDLWAKGDTTFKDTVTRFLAERLR
ncbi:MAG: hypothetical protein CMJ83_22565 [Planctomycetes bacterium]|nr:hypothetical protein [Planctomycetota bacterium]